MEKKILKKKNISADIVKAIKQNKTKTYDYVIGLTVFPEEGW